MKGLWCLTLPLCFRGQVLPAASLLNIVDVELIYEGVKYVLQVRAVLCPPELAAALAGTTGFSPGQGDVLLSRLEERDAINTRLSFKNVQRKNEFDSLS